MSIKDYLEEQIPGDDPYTCVLRMRMEEFCEVTEPRPGREYDAIAALLKMRPQYGDPEHPLMVTNGEELGRDGEALAALVRPLPEFDACAALAGLWC